MDVVFLGINNIGMKIYNWLCQRNKVDVIAMVTEMEQLDIVQKESPDLIISVGFEHLVPAEILAVPSEGAINLHPSYLPYNRGMSPNVWPLIEGTPAGVTLHYMDEEFDTGDIIAQQKVQTEFSDTGKDLHSRLEDAQFELFTQTWPKIESSNIETTPQEDTEGTYHTTADFVDACELNPEREVTIKEFLNTLRALTFPPFDNAYVEIDGTRYYVDIEIREETDESGDKAEGLVSSY